MDSGALFQDFLGQNPILIAFMAMACVPLFIIVGYIGISVYRRNQRQLNKSTPPAESSDALALLNQARSYSEDELPDLDLLSPFPPAQLEAGMVTLHTGQRIRAEKALTVFRDPRDGRLLVQIGETGYRSLAESPDAKRDFTRLMKELSATILQPDNAPPSETPANSNPELAPIAPAPVPSVADLLQQPETPPYTPTQKPEKPTRTQELPGDLPSYKFDDNPATIKQGRIGIKKVDFTPPPAVDIATAIEQFLQYKLRETGAFVGRELHILPAINGGVRIRVDDKFYDFVDDITDLEAKNFIKATIAEWQDRQA